AAQVPGRFEDVAGKGMPQQVRMHALEQALLLRELAYAQLDRARRDRSVATGEHRRLEGCMGRRAPFLQCIARVRTQRHAALLAALAEDRDEPVNEIEIAPAQPAQFA